jgi:hypothetical protein
LRSLFRGESTGRERLVERATEVGHEADHIPSQRNRVLESDEFLAPLMTTGLSAGSSRMLLRLSGQGRLVAGVKIVAGA